MDLAVDTVRLATRRADLVLAPGETILGGGTWLYSERQPTVTGLVDITALGWPAVTTTDAGLSVAATCTLAELHGLRLPVEWTAAPLLAQCCDALLASFKVWNVATVGGNVCLSLPAGALVALGAALDAEAVIWLAGGGERRMAVAEFVTGVGRNRLARGDVLRSLEFPRAALEARTAFRKAALSPLGRSGTVVIGRRDTGGSTTVTVTAATERPVVLRFPAPPSAAEVAAAVGAVDCWFEDVHGARDWRAHVTGLLAEEVRAELATAAGSPSGGPA